MPDATPSPFRLDTTADGDTVRIVVGGEIDLTTASDLETAITTAVAEPGARQVEVDLAEVSFMDSSGLRALIVGRRAATDDGKGFRVVAAAGVVERLFDVAGLTDLLG